MHGSIEVYKESNGIRDLIYEDSNIIVDGAGEAIADLLSFKRAPSSITLVGSGAIYDSSNFGIKAFTLGPTRDRYHLRDSRYALSGAYANTQYLASGNASSVLHCKLPYPYNYNFSSLPVSQPQYNDTSYSGLLLSNPDLTNFVRLESNGDFLTREVAKEVPNPEQCSLLGLYDYPGWTVIGNRRKKSNPAYFSGMGDVVGTASGINLICSSTTASPGNCAIYTTVRFPRNFNDPVVEAFGDLDKQKTMQIVFDMLSPEPNQDGVKVRVINVRTGESYVFVSSAALRVGEWASRGSDKQFTNTVEDSWETQCIQVAIPFGYTSDDFIVAFYPMAEASLSRTVYSIAKIRIGYLEGWDKIRVNGENTVVQVSSTYNRSASAGPSGLYVSSSEQNYTQKIINTMHGLKPDKAYGLVFKTEAVDASSYFNVVLRKRTIDVNKGKGFNHFTRMTYDASVNPVPPYHFNTRFAYDNGTNGMHLGFSPIGHPSAVDGVSPLDHSNIFQVGTPSGIEFTWINPLDSFRRKYDLSFDTYQVSAGVSNPCYRGFIELDQQWTPPGIGLEARRYNWDSEKWDIVSGTNKNSDPGESHRFYVGTSSFEDTNKWISNASSIIISTKNGAVDNGPYNGSFNIKVRYFWGGDAVSSISPVYVRSAKLVGLAPNLEKHKNEFPLRYYNWSTNRWTSSSIAAANRKTISTSSTIQTATPIVPGYSEEEEIDVILEVAPSSGEYFIHSARICDLSLLPYHGDADISDPGIVTSESEFTELRWDKPNGFFISFYNHTGDLSTSSRNYQQIDVKKDDNSYSYISLAFNAAGLRNRLHYHGAKLPFLTNNNFSFSFDAARNGGSGGHVIRAAVGSKSKGTVKQFDWDTSSWVSSRNPIRKVFNLHPISFGLSNFLATSGGASGIEQIDKDGEYMFTIWNIASITGFCISDFRLYEVTQKSESSLSSVPEFPSPFDKTLQSVVDSVPFTKEGHFLNYLAFSSLVPTAEEAFLMGAYLPGSGVNFASGTLGTEDSSGILSGSLNVYSVITPSGYILENTTARSSQALADASAGFIVSSSSPGENGEVKYVLSITYNEWNVLNHYYGGIGSMGLWSMDYRKTAEKRLTDPGPPFIILDTDSTPYATSLYNLTTMTQDKYHPEFKLFAKKVFFPKGIIVDPGTELVTIVWTIKF